ncbi:MAG: hypothetical protein ACYC1C_19285, partial [Chloroflexota bacterium]
ALEVWGWSDEGLQHVKDFTLTPNEAQLSAQGIQGLPRVWLNSTSKLSICSHPGECREGLGWTGTLLVPWDDDDRSREFVWSTDASIATGAVWQLSRQPFPSEQFDPAPPGLVASRTLSGKLGSFYVDFAAFAEPPLAEGGTATLPSMAPGKVTADPSLKRFEDASSDTPTAEQGAVHAEAGPLAQALAGVEAGLAPQTGVQINFPRQYYARLVPIAGTTQIGPPSNTVLVTYGPQGEQENPLVPPPPPIYQVEIDSFTPVVFPRGDLWGCVELTRNDRYTGELSALNPDPWSVVPVGATICPQIYKGEGEPSWYESLWDFVKGAVDWVAAAYESIKNAVVDFVAAAIPFCGDTCKDMLKMGLNAALVAVGLPPSLPSFDALTEMGEGYLVSFLAEQVGADCSEGSLCQDAIKEGIDQLKEQARAGGNNASCMPVEEAHRYGREPLCLPAGVVGKPIKYSDYEPAQVNVRITRRPDAVEVAESDYTKYILHVSNWTTNDELVGQTVLLPVNTWLYDGEYNYARTDDLPLKIDEPLAGVLFGVGDITVPRLRQGESIVLPLPMTRLEYWIPEHKEMIYDAGGYVRYDDWYRLYFEGDLTVRTSVDCFTTVGWQNCGYAGKGYDELTVTLPADYWP